MILMDSILHKHRALSFMVAIFLIAASLFLNQRVGGGGIARAEEIAAPGIPNLVSPGSGAWLKTPDVNLSWNTSAGGSHLAGYELKITSSAFGGPSNAIWIEAPATQYQTVDLPDGDYQWQVRAKDTGGNYSAWSGQRSFGVDTRAPSVPTGITATAIANGKSKISWTAVTGAAAYRVYREGIKVGETKQATYTDSGLNDRGTYKYYVSALDQAGNEGERGGPAMAVPSPLPTPTGATDAREADSRNVTEIEAGEERLAAPSEGEAADSEDQVAGVADEVTADGDKEPADLPVDSLAAQAAKQVKAETGQLWGQPWWLWFLVAVAAGLGVWLVFRRRKCS